MVREHEVGEQEQLDYLVSTYYAYSPDTTGTALDHKKTDGDDELRDYGKMKVENEYAGESMDEDETNGQRTVDTRRDSRTNRRGASDSFPIPPPTGKAGCKFHSTAPRVPSTVAGSGLNSANALCSAVRTTAAASHSKALGSGKLGGTPFYN